MTPQEALVAIARERDIDALVAQPEMLRGHLMDYCRSGNRREFNLLVTACQSRVPQVLRAPSSSVLQVDRIADLARRMVDDHGIGDEHARWAVETWALALGVSTAPVTDLRPSDPVRRQVPERVPDPVPEQARINYAGKDLRGRDFKGQDLTGANLVRADLTRANLNGANLSGAELGMADLTEANLTGARLHRANLFYATLSGATLSRADLTRANLRRANLRRANLSGANLSGAKLTEANLSGANLSEAKLTEATLTGADLFGANMEGVKGLDTVKGLVK